MAEFETEQWLQSPTGAGLCLRVEPAAGTARANILLLHGLAEHSLRYARLANELAHAGLNVFAHDHRGHGLTRTPNAPPRSFAARGGDVLVLEDCRAVLDAARERAPGLPVLVLGHSMGGIVAINLARLWGGGIAGALVWNADVEPRAELWAARAALKVERALKGSDVPSLVMARATFESWARAVPDATGEADWVSHDSVAARLYLDDPLCGWRPSVSMWRDVLSLIRSGGSSRALAAIPNALPLHILGGTQDPATRRGRAQQELAARLRRAGKSDVRLHLVDGARHETLNETEPYRGEAIRSLFAFIDAVLQPVGEASSAGSTKANSTSSSGVNT